MIFSGYQALLHVDILYVLHRREDPENGKYPF